MLKLAEADFRLKYADDLNVTDFLATAAMHYGGSQDLSGPQHVLSDNWVETVGDLRLLLQEGLLREIGLPLGLCRWIQAEITAYSFTNTPREVSTTPRSEPLVAAALQGRGLWFHHQADLDEHGLLYYIGSRRKTQPWSNPAEAGLVLASASSLCADSTPASAICGRVVERCVTKVKSTCLMPSPGRYI